MSHRRNEERPQLCHSCGFGMEYLQEQRGAGIGSALIAGLTEWANSAGLRRIQLNVFAHDVGAIRRLYRRLGYEVEGAKREAIKIGDRYEDLVEMAYVLSENPGRSVRALICPDIIL